MKKSKVENKEPKNEIDKNETEENVSIASMVIDKYADQVDDLQITKEKFDLANKRLGWILLVVIILLALETAYIIICWDSMHPHIGIFK